MKANLERHFDFVVARKGIATPALVFVSYKTPLNATSKETWVEQNRRKSTSKGTLPLLPLCLEIIQKFENHPRCLRSGKLLPLPSAKHTIEA